MLSFVASFLGATLARSNDADEAVPAPTASETQPSTEDYEAALEEILPAGAAVRAGAGVPESGKGYEGEVYIDISTSDVYLFKDGEWVNVGNIRTSAAENLTGETGAAGETARLARPVPRARAVRRVLRARRSHWRRNAPGDEPCEADGDIYIYLNADTGGAQFYECTDSAWTLVWPCPLRRAPHRRRRRTPTADRRSAFAAFCREQRAPVRGNPLRRTGDGLGRRVAVGRSEVGPLGPVVGLEVPEPLFAGLEAANDAMPGGFVVLGGVSVEGVVAASDVPAQRAPAQMHPPGTGRVALDAAVAARRHGRIDERGQIGHGVTPSSWTCVQLLAMLPRTPARTRVTSRSSEPGPARSRARRRSRG